MLNFVVPADTVLSFSGEKMHKGKGKEKVDVEVINNTGCALYGAFKETSIYEIKAQFETNFLAQ